MMILNEIFKKTFLNELFKRGFQMQFYFLMKLSFKLNKLNEDQGFHCGDISKQY